MAAAVRLWSPLRSDEYITDARRGQALARLVLSVRAYGETDIDAERSSPPLPRTTTGCTPSLKKEHTGDPGFLTYWHQAHRRVVATRQWYAAKQQRPGSALSTAGGTQ